MSDIRFNQWLHQSGTGGVSQVDGGHVGIGTTNPEIAVHSGNSKILNVGIVTASTYYGDGSNLTNINSTSATGDFSIADTIKHIGDTNTKIRFPEADAVTIETNGSERLRITSAGHIGFNRSNVAINDTSFQQAVVEPSRFVFNNNYSNNYTDASLKLYLFMYGATRQGFTSGPNYDLQYHSSGHATHAKHSFFTQNTERLRITAAGLVQIGLTGKTGGDDQALAVNNPAGNANVLELSTSNATGRINCSRTLSNTLNTTSYIEWGEPGAQGTGDLKFGTSASSNNPTERLRIDSSGHISQGGGATPSSSNGAIGLKFGIKSTQNNVIIGETTQSGAGYGLHIESRQTGRSGDARFAQIGLRNDTSGNGQISFFTAPSSAGVVERMNISSAGLVTRPYQYFLHAERSGNQTGYNGGGAFGTPMIFNHIVTENKDSSLSSCFNTSNGLFTAPVTGVYLFNAAVYGGSGNIFSQSWFTLNGGRANGTDWVINSNFNFVQNTQSMRLAAGNTVGFHPYASGQSNVTLLANPNHTYFKVTLIG